MSQDYATGAVFILAAGIGIGAWAALRIRSGKSYISNPPMRVFRQDDPFSFWLSVAPTVILAAVLIAGGIMGLIKST